MVFATLIVTLLWVIVHLFAARWLGFQSVPRSVWLSIAGGVSVSYVFVHILPEVAEAQEVLEEQSGVSWLSHHAYLVALAGLSTFYGLERLASQRKRGPAGNSAPAFWLHIGSFAIYNAFVAYLLLRGHEGGTLSLTYYAFAMGLHFLVTDHGLREHHRARYHARGRWVLAAALFAGWVCSVAVKISERWLVLIFAFLAGGVVLNVLKEELPRERESRFWAFALGAGLYALVLVAL